MAAEAAEALRRTVVVVVVNFIVAPAQGLEVLIGGWSKA
jgi:hypothetical protein